jgi:alkanesulfonate monooxygenase SsuD/methylene tetrahydromethanopterin reductase-like flavin-dependent oxidoreductase (luciferase family)
MLLGYVVFDQFGGLRPAPGLAMIARRGARAAQPAPEVFPMPMPRIHPWVEQFQHKVGFGLQPVPRPDDPAPSRRLLDLATLAEALGYDAFFLGDHPAYMPDPWLHLSAAAMQTRRIRLGSVVLCAAYRLPLVTARLAADLDRLSDGRFILGLGHGWNEAEFAQLGIPFPPIPERQKALAETVEIIDGVWGREPFTFHGQFHSVTDARIVPPPIQQPRPPLILAGGGEGGGLRLVARFADACNFGPGHATGLARSADEVRRKLDALRRHCVAEGRPFASILRTHFTSWLMVAPDETSANAKRDRYYPQGLSEEQRHSRVVGAPDEVAAYYQGLVDLGMQYFVVQVQDATDVETIELLAREVMPRIVARPA